MSPRRILIVDDQREVGRLLRSALETLDYKLDVVEMPSGEEAILDASHRRVDLLVSDYRLPGISGTELIEKIRAYHPEMKVILITGVTDPKVRRKLAEFKADAFFTKPIPIADFLDAVERGLGLVQVSLPGEEAAAVEPETQSSLSKHLADLRKAMNAKTVILLNDRGRILARAGDLPDNSTEVSLTSALMAIFSAGQKVARLIGQKTPSSWHVFENGDHNLIFAPVGTTHAMLVIGEKLASEKKILNSIRAFSNARQGIAEILKEMGFAPLAAEPASRRAAVQEEPVAASGLDEMMPLFKQAKKKLKQEDVDAFWDAATEKREAAPINSDVLSYEQARKLGLTSEDGGD